MQLSASLVDFLSLVAKDHHQYIQGAAIFRTPGLYLLIRYYERVCFISMRHNFATSQFCKFNPITTKALNSSSSMRDMTRISWAKECNHCKKCVISPIFFVLEILGKRTLPHSFLRRKWKFLLPFNFPEKPVSHIHTCVTHSCNCFADSFADFNCNRLTDLSAFCC